MFEKLEAVEKRYEELTQMISDPEIISNQNEWKKLVKEHSNIEDVVLKFREYKKALKKLEDAKEMMEDPELKELAEVDFHDAKNKIPQIEEEIKFLLKSKKIKSKLSKKIINNILKKCCKKIQKNDIIKEEKI